MTPTVTPTRGLTPERKAEILAALDYDDPAFDKPMESLCRAFNDLPGVVTYSSRTGHGDETHGHVGMLTDWCAFYQLTDPNTYLLRMFDPHAAPNVTLELVPGADADGNYTPLLVLRFPRGRQDSVEAALRAWAGTR